VIVFLVYLAHVLGESLRRMLSHSTAESPAAAPTIRSYRRQFTVPAVLGFAGIVTVVSVLWLARDRVEETTAQRAAEVEARIEATTGELETARAAGDLVGVGRFEQEVAGLHVLQGQRVERADYAVVIGRMNLPILLLNVVLALAAAVAGYLSTRDALRGSLVSPRAAELRRHLRELRAESVRSRGALAALNADTQEALARAEYLVTSRPTRGWEAKAERLGSVIPRFRSENARRRGVDTANIAAFRRPPTLVLALADAAVSLARPAELQACRERHRELRVQAAAVLARMQGEASQGSAAPRAGGVASTEAASTEAASTEAASTEAASTEAASTGAASTEAAPHVGGTPTATGVNGGAPNAGGNGGAPTDGWNGGGPNVEGKGGPNTGGGRPEDAPPVHGARSSTEPRDGVEVAHVTEPAFSNRTGGAR
jgi:hypothetical protein